MTRRRVDALVLGAGAAGLAAARDLSQAGLELVVLEARDRIGGRVHTLHDPNWPVPVELGAEFIHGEAKETFAIARAAALKIDELPEDHLLAHGGRFSSAVDFWAKVEETIADLGRTMRGRRGDISFIDYLEGRKLPTDLRQMLLLYVEGYHASHADRISARWLAAGGNDDSAGKQFRLPSGTDAILRWLRDGLEPERVELRLNTVATAVRWKRREVIVEAATGGGRQLDPFRARAAIVTVPLPVLKAKALPVHPEPPALDRALRSLEAGHVFKIVLRFRSAFWEEAAFVRRLGRPLNFLHSREAEVPTWWTALPGHAPVLTGWAGGRQAEELLDQGEATRLERALSALSGVLGVPRRLIDELLESSSHHDWRSDPFSRGAYTYVGVGGLAAQKAFARPVEGTLFFAGEATDVSQTGTVAGALASGRRAAAQVLHSLGGRAPHG